jgi:hypothetical protein
MEFTDYARLTTADTEALRRSLAPLRTLGDLLEWGRRQLPPLPAPSVVTQDEYTHDVLLPHGPGRWLDFDTT